MSLLWRREAHAINMIDFDAVIPRSKVVETAFAFLESCGFRLEIEEGKFVTIPRSTELVLWSRAFVRYGDVDGWDHYEANVMLGRLDGEDWPDFGYLKLYFNPDGGFVTEDRFPRYCGQYDQAQ